MFTDQMAAEKEALATGEEKGVKETDAPIIRYVHMLVTEAVKRRASDIHLEPLEKRFRIRYRIDGVLLEVENPPKRLQPPIISRLKLMANVSLADCVVDSGLLERPIFLQMVAEFLQFEFLPVPPTSIDEEAARAVKAPIARMYGCLLYTSRCV